MDRRTDGQTDGWTDHRKEGLLYKCKDVLSNFLPHFGQFWMLKKKYITDQRTNGLTEPWTNGQTKYLTTMVATTVQVSMLLQTFKAIFTEKNIALWTDGPTDQRTD